MITFQTPLIQIPRPELADDVRRCAVAIAQWSIGLDASSEKIERLLQLYGPGIAARDVRSPKWSGCGVTAEGIHRFLRVGSEDPEAGEARADCLYQPYFPAALRNGRRQAIVRAQIYLRAMGAWQEPALGDAEPRPQPGAYVVQGRKLPGEWYGGTPHVGTLLRWEGDVAVFADGGQRGSHGEQIEKVHRRWELHQGRVRLVDLRPENGGAWRYVLGWGDVDVMTLRGGLITVPEGWQTMA